MKPCLPTAVLLAAVLILPAAAAEAPPAEGAATAAASPLSLVGLEVTPAEPGVDTLCQLRVKIANRGEKPVSSLAFTVALGGKPLPVYGNQLFMPRLDPGATSELRLYNFWTTETGGPAPADGKLTVEVALTEARWLEITTDDEGVETWKPLEPVAGLPVEVATTLTLAR